MKKSNQQQSFDRLEQLISQHANGVGLRALVAGYASVDTGRVSERTLRRRLAEMTRNGILETRGKSRSTLYFVAGPKPTVDTERTDADEYIALSTEGEQARTLVRAPMLNRRAVGYQEHFLDNYRPGATWYLPEAMRARLHELGRTPDALRPAGTYAHDIFERLLIDLAWGSSKLEGNTYSKLDTQNLLEHGIRADGKDAAEAQMLLNHKKAIEFLVEQAEEINFNKHTLFTLHAMLSENLLANPKDEGRLRTHVVNVGGTTYVPISIPQKIEEHFDVILAKASDIPDPFEQSFFVMVHVPYLQPFADVNKRTSRLAANIPFIKQNLCPLSFIGVTERAYVEGTLAVYEFNRVELLRDVYLWAYERSCAQYRVVRDSIIQPDPIRMRFREQLSSLLHDFVVNGTAPIRSKLEQWAERNEITEEYRAAFVDTALRLLVDLHEGTIYRYRIRPSEFKSWKQKITA